VKTNLRAALAVACLLALGCFSGPAEAGQLMLVNNSNAPITCTVDGWTKDSGGAADWLITVGPNGGVYYVGQNTARASGAVINWASCGALKTRVMNITPTGPNGRLVLNGQQNRVLNVSLYSFIPNEPFILNAAGATFDTLIAHAIQTYQDKSPQVLLNVQMNLLAQNTKPTRIYNFTELPAQLAKDGFDVMEIDTLYLGALVTADVINPAKITGDEPFPVALAASSLKGELWGIPSWLCMDFIYSRDESVRKVTTLQALLKFLNGRPMAGTYNGSWRLPSIYINAFVQTHGYGAIDHAMTMPPDPEAIGNLFTVTSTCAANGVNPCTDATYYSSTTPGVAEQVFARGQADADMSFSEQSFYIDTYQPGNLHAAPSVWGNTPQPLLFSDTFVTSKANCAGDPCAADAIAFTTMMTGAEMKAYIVQSDDLPGASPWRTLLVATQPFYKLDAIAKTGRYDQFMPVLLHGRPFPNTFTQDIQTDMKYKICKALKDAAAEAHTTYTCELAPQVSAAPVLGPAAGEKLAR